jgi:hypothetical protein
MVITKYFSKYFQEFSFNFQGIFQNNPNWEYFARIGTFLTPVSGN